LQSLQASSGGGRSTGTQSAVDGTAWFLESAGMGVLYDVSIGHILAYVVIIEAAALIAYLWLLLIRDPG